MGLIHTKDGEFDKAIYWYKQALKVQNGPRAELATVYPNLGLLFYDTGNYLEALGHHSNAIELIDEKHSKWEEFKKKLRPRRSTLSVPCNQREKEYNIKIN